ncbi:MAG: M61 family metallopeptidase [Gammaproteobacteria bacterium]
MSDVQYSIRPHDPAGHLFEVSLTVSRPDPKGQQFNLPAWTPGSYMIRDFARHIVGIDAWRDGAPVPLAKLDKQTWRAAPGSGPLMLRYRVYAWDLSVRAAHLDVTHAYFNGAAVFLAVRGQENQGSEVVILPSEEGGEDWRVSTAMQAVDVDERGFGRYGVADYEELIDHPVEIGTQVSVSFTARGVPHEIALTGRLHPDTDTQRLAADMERICARHIDLFGGQAPMDRYLFLIMVVGDGYGGLEHRASSSNMCKRDDLPRGGLDAPDEGYRNLLGLLSHEYFHSWNIKRIKPAAFVPYDLEREVHTELLWAFEGITSYYDDLGLVRSGVISRESYLELLGRTITRVRRGSGRLKQTLTESSFDAWTRFYKQDENAPNAIVSYYTKGALAALCLDLTLRAGTGGACTLDTVMAELWRRHGVTGAGVPEDGLETLATELSGLEMGAFFDALLRGTGDPPLEELLDGIGVKLSWRAATGSSDPGGRAAERTPRSVLGARVLDERGEARLAAVFEGGAAHRAGLSAGDAVIAVNGLRVSGANLEERVARFEPGDQFELWAFRRDELMRFQVSAQAPAPDTAVLTLREDADPEVLKGWLG